MRFEQARLDSFKSWPKPFINPKELAASGFYYTGVLDKVRCFKCNLELSHWTKGNVPGLQHERYGSLCHFFWELPCGNVPITINPEPIRRDVPNYPICRCGLCDSTPKRDDKRPTFMAEGNKKILRRQSF